MKLFAVMGDERVAHSLSPKMHNAVLKAMGIDGMYAALQVKPMDVPEAVAGIRALGFAGVNVTVPHKLAVAREMDALVGEAEALGAVNTIVNLNGRLIGHNTDVGGFCRAVWQAGFDMAGCRALVLGAGGASRAVILGLAQSGAGKVTVAARDAEKARPAAALAGGRAAALADLPALASEADIIVNTTSVSSPAEAGPTAELAAQAAGHSRARLVVDINYGREQNIWRDMAGANGADFCDGRIMLAAQAALSFALWTGRTPDLSLFTEALQS